jgi:uncharacterized protein YdiU (UPF0061 family)
MNNEIKYKDHDMMGEILSRAAEVKKRNVTQKKATKNSLKKLQFELKEEDSTLTREIKKRMNEGHYTQHDVDEFFKGLARYEGNEKKAKDKAYNSVYGLRKRPTMIDETFELWCEFLELDIHLKPRDK